MDLARLKDVGGAQWEIAPAGGMRVPGRVFALRGMLPHLAEDEALAQVANVAHLPGIVGYSLAMPDIHWGYGFPIGGVAAFDPDEGVISPGGVGYDINCGVRLLRTDLALADVRERVEPLVRALLAHVPSGVGAGGPLKVAGEELARVLEERFEGRLLPSKLKIGVSGCARNCSSSFLSDLGFIGTWRGWMVFFGGNGARRPRIADLVASNLSDAQALDLADRLVDYYATHGRSGERTARFVERLGLETIRSELLRFVPFLPLE